MSKDKNRHLAKYKILGNNIRKYRKLQGLSQEELAFRISSARNYIGCIERAEKLPSLNTVFDIASELQIDIKDLL
jgi:transcriptional regulator with XRE-family HTH domain